MFSSFDKSMLNLLQSESREADALGNLFQQLEASQQLHFYYINDLKF